MIRYEQSNSDLNGSQIDPEAGATESVKILQLNLQHAILAINELAKIFTKNHTVLYILTSVWVLYTPNYGQNSHFQHFLCVKAQKERNLPQNLAKNGFFKFASKS